MGDTKFEATAIFRVDLELLWTNLGSPSSMIQLRITKQIWTSWSLVNDLEPVKRLLRFETG